MRRPQRPVWARAELRRCYLQEPLRLVEQLQRVRHPKMSFRHKVLIRHKVLVHSKVLVRSKQVLVRSKQVQGHNSWRHALLSVGPAIRRHTPS
jgi:hypothetical protein